MTRSLFMPLGRPLGSLYARAMSYRRARFSEAHRMRLRLCRPVVSIGNITVGGTGKTPMAILLAKRLSEEGLSVSVLSRGYGGRRTIDPMVVEIGGDRQAMVRQVGDEPYLIALEAPSARVVVGQRRHEAGLLSERLGQVDIHILDDGFQHLELHRDLDIVMVSAGCPIEPARCLPAGPYREPPEALHVASFLVIKTDDGAIPPDLARVLERHAPRASVHAARFEPMELRAIAGDVPCSPEALRGRSVAAFAAIGEPASFVSSLERLGAEIVRFERFPDHHAFRAGEIEAVARRAASRGAEIVLCTFKDAVRLPPLHPVIPLAALHGHLSVSKLDVLLDRVRDLARGAAGRADDLA